MLALAAWYVTHAQGDAPAAKSTPPTVVGVVSAQRRDVPVVLQANGTVQPLASVELHAQVVSTIRQVHIREGQFVKAGELMFSLDDRSDRSNVDKAQAQLARDQAAMADVARQVQRGTELYAQKFIAQGALDTLRSQLESARALVGADAAALASSKVSASYNLIRAPMAGRVGAINVYPGSLVQLATALTTITQLDPINVTFTLPEANLADLLDAQRKGAVPVAATLGNGGKPIPGLLSFVDNTVDPSAGTIRVKAQFDNRDTRLWPGQYVNTRITVKTLVNAVVIPQNAIISNTRGTFVYTMEADHSAKQRAIVRLLSFELMAAVSGLEGGEQVIVEGKQNLRPDAKVRLADAPVGAVKKGAAQ